MERNFIGDTIFDLNKMLKTELETEFKSLNIGAGQLHILLKLYEVDTSYYRQSDLADDLGIDKSNASRKIGKLKDKGLVDVIQINKRDKGIKLTSLSRGYKEEIINSLKEISTKMTNGISNEELLTTYRVINLMNRNLKK